MYREVKKGVNTYMKAKIDDYFNNGIFEIVRVGNNIIHRNVLPSNKQQELWSFLEGQETVLKKEINELIQTIRHNVIQCDPLQLLNYSQMMFLHSILGKPSECQLMGVENLAVARATEYIQSILVSSQPDFHETQGDPTNIFSKISADIEELYRLITQYYFAYGATYKKDHKDDCEILDELIEAQLFYSVRGERYQYFEEEYNKHLLSPHNDVFMRLFGLSSQDIVDGISKLQYALSQARFDSLRELVKMFDSLQSVPEGYLEEFMESQKTKGQELIQKFMGTELNDVCKITGWNEAFVDELSFGLNECGEFWNQKDYAGWPVIDLPTSKRPFIKIDNQYYCFDYYSLSDHIYRAIQKTITRLDSTYSWSRVQNEASESMVESVFQKLLPGCTTNRNNYYPINGSLKRLCENDLIVQYDDVLFIVEVKASSFAYTPPLTDFESHIKSYCKLIEEPNSQCVRTKDYLSSCKIAKFYNEDKSDKFLIDMSSITDIIMFSISVDNINTFASHAEKLSFIKTKCGAICIAIDDLMVYQDYFDSPLKFIHFLKQRMKASLLPALVTTDELDHLGLYIEYNCYSMCFEGSDASRINPVGYRKDLDVFYGQRFHPELHPEKPSQNLPPLFEEIISLLERNGSKDRIAFSDYLLNFSSEAKEQFAEEVLHTYEDQKKTHRSKIITTAGRNENDLRYSCFIFQPDVPAISNSGQEEYIWSNMLWNEEKNRIKINITFDDRRRIIDIGYSCFDEKSIPLDRRDILFEQGKTRAAERIQKYCNVNGNKIGRNELCPCGSGKKYKKCCGRNF